MLLVVGTVYSVLIVGEFVKGKVYCDELDIISRDELYPIVGVNVRLGEFVSALIFRT